VSFTESVSQHTLEALVERVQIDNHLSDTTQPVVFAPAAAPAKLQRPFLQVCPAPPLALPCGQSSSGRVFVVCGVCGSWA
jgi:hypothetical protein